MRGYLAVTAMLLATIAQAQSATSVKRLYIHEKVATVGGFGANCSYGSCSGFGSASQWDYSLLAAKAFIKRCPDTLSITGNKDAADYSLKLSVRSSILYDKNGDMVYTRQLGLLGVL